MSAANGDYAFRPMTAADMPMARRWLETPEVQHWWGDADGQVSLLEEDIEDPRMSRDRAESTSSSASRI